MTGSFGIVVSALALFGAACASGSSTQDTTVAAGERTDPGPRFEPSATPRSHDPAAGIPEAIRGEWREDDLGRAPTGEDCLQTLKTMRNFGKVLSVYPDMFTRFESGGRLEEIHERGDTMIDATFDTTYATGEPTLARKRMALEQNGVLTLESEDAEGHLSVTFYRRCPGG